MIKAWKEQLRVLAIDPNSQFDSNLRKRVGKRATPILEGRLKELIFLSPSLVSRIYSHWARQKKASKVNRIAGFLLTYLYHPKDFLADDEYGLFGYLDDAYLVAVVYERVLQELLEEGVALSREDLEFLERVGKLKQTARSVIRKESQKIDEMVREILEGNKNTYLALFD